MDVGAVDRLEDNIRRDIDLDSAVNMSADIFQPDQIVDAGISEVLDYTDEDLSQITVPDFVVEFYIFIGVIQQVPERVLHDFVIKRVVRAMFGSLVGLLGTAPHDFAEADDIGVGELDDLLQLLSGEVEVDYGLEEGRV